MTSFMEFMTYADLANVAVTVFIQNAFADLADVAVFWIRLLLKAQLLRNPQWGDNPGPVGHVHF